MINGDVPLNLHFALSGCRALTKCDEYSICIAIIAVEYQITNNVH